MILSQRQLEEIAASTTKDFNRFFFGDEADKPDRSALPTPIDQFAKNYLGLRVSFARLSPDGSICGVTAYADTEYKITELGITRTLALKRNQVILDESFIRSGNVQRLCAKRRFTLAHECAHQILFQLESEEVKASCEMKYSARTAYTPRELKTREDWNEWQANVLGAAILLPQKEVDLAMRRFEETPLINYEGRYSYHDHLTLRLFCRLFGVSKSAFDDLTNLITEIDKPQKATEAEESGLNAEELAAAEAALAHEKYDALFEQNNDFIGWIKIEGTNVNYPVMQTPNNFSAVVPYDMELQRKESKEFLDDLTTRDQRMMFAVVTMVITADTKEQLDLDTETVLSTARKHMCQMATLKYQQTDVLNTVLPIGTRKINAFRTLTTESLAVLMPFKVQEIMDKGGIYFGENAISHNLIMCNKANLLNQSAFLLGVPGSGKSFSAKELISLSLKRSRSRCPLNSIPPALWISSASSPM